MAKPRAYSYIRFSRPEQMRGNSLARQIEASRAYADEHGLELVEEYRDLGVSAQRGKHVAGGALGQFLAAVHNGKVAPGSILLVESLDRLSRQEIDIALEQMLGIIRKDIRIVTLMDKQVYDRESIRASMLPLMLSITIMARAYEESRTKGERVATAWAAKRKDAADTGKALTSRAPAWLDVGPGRTYSPNAHAETVRRIYEETAAGIGRASIVRRLNAEGVKPLGLPKGKKNKDKPHFWHTSAVQKVLDHIEVTGAYQPFKVQEVMDFEGKPTGVWKRMKLGDPIPNIFPAIVPDDLYRRAQAMRESRKRIVGNHGKIQQRGTGGPKGTTYANLFSGLARCSCCGGPMTRVNKGQPPKGGTYLACDRARRAAGGCNNKRMWRYDHVEAAVLASADRLDINRVILNEAPALTAEAERIAAMEARLADMTEERRGWGRLATKGDDMAEAEFDALAAPIKVLAAELAEARRVYAQEQVLAADPVEQIGAVRSLSAALTGAQDNADLFALRARLAQELRRVVGALTLSPERVAITWGSAASRGRWGLPAQILLGTQPGADADWDADHDIDAFAEATD